MRRHGLLIGPLKRNAKAREKSRAFFLVMPALVAGIHVLHGALIQTWMAGTSPAMTPNLEATKKQRPLTKRRAFIRRRLVVVAVKAMKTHRLLQNTLHLRHDIGMTARQGHIYAGIGGWTYEPWRGVFYPKGLSQARELTYAGEHLTSIEINGTFYRTQTPTTSRKWASEVPETFVFSVKGPRYAVNRRVLSEAGDSIKRFLDSGVTELGKRLGPLLWQFTRYKKFDDKDFGGFLELLPKTFNGHALRHVVEVRHDSFKVPAFIDLLRQFEIPVVFAEHDRYPAIADLVGDFVYARLQKGDEKLKAGYPPKALDGWATRAKVWAEGGEPKDLPRVVKASAKKQPRDVFMYFIHEAKLRAPAAAMALIERLK